MALSSRRHTEAHAVAPVTSNLEQPIAGVTGERLTIGKIDHLTDHEPWVSSGMNRDPTAGQAVPTALQLESSMGSGIKAADVKQDQSRGAGAQRRQQCVVTLVKLQGIQPNLAVGRTTIKLELTRHRPRQH
jgi:hypothetical protein